MPKQLWAAGATLALALGIVLWPLDQPARPPPAAASARTEQEQGSVPSGASARQDEPTSAPASAPPPARAALASPTVSARRAERERADVIRFRLGERRPHRSAGAAADAPRAGSDSVTPTLSEAEQMRRREYLRRAVQEQYIPVARSCYEELLARQPQAGGKVVLEFSIVGDAEVDAGGVVDQVDLRDDTTMDDPEFVQCMRESLYSTVFEPPPPGASRTTVVYPLELHP